ncbi:MAG: hypothetical protein HQL12_08970 [Candidatus Omnitrophica bacterium]|nr:hypothetical protein [Candidatus Omnitrophota bacterium]
MISFCLFTKASAETIILQSGQKIEGRIIEDTELRVMVDVRGIPRTFFLGEIASIDGKKIEMPHEKAVDMALSEVMFVNKRPLHKDFVPRAQAQPAVTSEQAFFSHKHASAHQDPEKLEDLVYGMHEMMGKMANVNNNVVSTPDGGLIVVSHENIVKYDKNLNIVKKVDLKPEEPAGSK